MSIVCIISWNNLLTDASFFLILLLDIISVAEYILIVEKESGKTFLLITYHIFHLYDLYS